MSGLGHEAGTCTPWPKWAEAAQKYVEYGDDSGGREESRARLDFDAADLARLVRTPSPGMERLSP
jgi:hypothetical protein